MSSLQRYLRLGRKITVQISLSADSSSSTVTQGSTTTRNLTLTRTNFSDPVTLSATGLPSGVTASFSNTTLSGATLTSILTLTATGGASVVTNSAYSIIADGGGGVSSTVNSTVTVAASSSRGVPTSTGIIKQDQFSYADKTALLAAMPATADTFNFSKLYSFVGNSSSYSMIDLSTSVQFEGHNTMSFQIDNASSSPPQIQVYFSPTQTTYQNVGLYWVMKHAPGFTTVGTQSGQSNGYKIAALAYSGTSGRTGLEYTNTDQYSYVGGWGPGNIASQANNYDVLAGVTLGSGAAQAKSTPYSPNPSAGGGTWNTGAAVCNYMEYRKVNSTQAEIKFWTWIYGTTPGVNPDSHMRITIDTAASGLGASAYVPPIDRIAIGQNYNHGLGFRPSAPYYIYWCDWRVYDLDTNSNPCNL